MYASESIEDYLENILILSQRLPVVRSVDVATEMNFKKSSISVAVKKLKELEYIQVSDAGYITLTPEGNRIAEAVYERHRFLSGWLMDLGVSEETALSDACRLEHIISAESYAAIKAYVAKYSDKSNS